MTIEKDNKLKFRLDDIPKNQCKLFEIGGEKVAVCHDPDGKFRFYRLKPLIRENKL
ncbi:MAG: hypothetical protein ACP6IY_11150 [Promethearchaeia archaeon]